MPSPASTSPACRPIARTGGRIRVRAGVHPPVDQHPDDGDPRRWRRGRSARSARARTSGSSCTGCPTAAGSSRARRSRACRRCGCSSGNGPSPPARGRTRGTCPPSSDRLTRCSATYVGALKTGDLDKAAECLDLAEIPGPARRLVGRELAFKLKEVLDRNLFMIFQDIPDTSVGLPLEAVVHKEGRITAERQVSGKRKGQWLFNRATVGRWIGSTTNSSRSPSCRSWSRPAAPRNGPRSARTPGLWLRHRLPELARSIESSAGGSWSLAAYQFIGMALLVAADRPVRTASRPGRLDSRSGR